MDEANEISEIKAITETFERRYKDIKKNTAGSKFVLIDTVWEVVDYYYNFILIFGANERYRKNIDIQRNIIKICMKNDSNHEWLKRQYELASMARIGYEIPYAEYQYG